MNTFYWLVKREFWEHRGSFLWTPVITTAVIVALNIMVIIFGLVAGGRHGTHLMWQQLAAANPDDIKKVSALLDVAALMPFVVASIVLFFVLFGYCMKSLSSDRNDRSILFWKSLPISDLNTVISKAFSAIVVAPIIMVIVSIIGAVLVYLTYAITAALHGINFGTVMWTLPHPGNLIASMAGILPIYMVWILPSVGWLMLCSAWSKGKVARWAIALPVGVGVILTWVGAMATWSGSAPALGNSVEWLWKNVILRAALGLFPGGWASQMSHMAAASYNSDTGWQIDSLAGALANNVGHQYHLLWSPAFLWGALAGVIMLAVAIWLRRWRTEL